MKDRDFLWCLVNQLLDDQEELEQLCPACGAPVEESAAGTNESFDMERFLALKEGRV